MDQLLDMELEELMNVKVETASGIAENLRNAPAAMLVITAQDIQERGYTSLDEVFQDLPGFDVVKSSGPTPMTAYQRGYRTPALQRTLFMIDGNVDNLLWSQTAILSRQYPISAIDHIEVLYGPTSAVYGPNAFLGIVNVITHTGEDLAEGDHHFQVTGQVGSFQSRAVELLAQGKQSNWSYNLAARFFRSDEAGLDDYPKSWGYTTTEWLNHSQVWGPVLQLENNGVKYGEYYDPSRDWGVLGDLHYKDFTFGFNAWQVREGYGPYYSFDHVQPNVLWQSKSSQTYLQHELPATPNLKVTTLALYEQSVLGDNDSWQWVEASTDRRPGMANYSYLSITDFYSENRSWLFKQDYDYQWSETFRWTGGIKYEARRLTRGYEACYYWSSSFCELVAPGDEGPYGLGPGVFHSSDPEVLPVLQQPIELGEMPDSNLVNTTDWGAYSQGIWDLQQWRLHAGVRYDHNSIYGSSVNPRLSLIYQPAEEMVVKLLYGTAFQEPPGILLWGGWSGRRSNPELQPEKAQNLELVWMYRTKRWLHDFSLFTAHYDDVIKEEAQNAGSRDVYGLEYRGRYSFPNFLIDAPSMTGYTYYTFTQSRSSIHYDFTTNQWVEGEDNLGDIAPHKLNLGLTLPFNTEWSLNVRANYASQTELYLRNPLRAEGKEAEAHTTFHLNLGYHTKDFTASLKILNVFDQGYLLPGLEQADSGDDFEQRSTGFRNSFIPQVGRTWWLTASQRF
jgi:iron complex outermembrane receptor protein